MTSIQRIKGANGVIIDSNAYLELPKAPTKTTSDAIRSGMIRYNDSWKSFEGVIGFDDDSVAYRRFAFLDENGRLLTSQLPESVTSGLEYAGTFDPVQDDIDPPYTYMALPTPSATTNGDYYIVRSIQDSAAKHLLANPTTQPFVIFTPTNPSGNWTQIKYYIGKDPTTGANTVVINAFARFIPASIPATGHVGLLSLVNNNPDLIAAFNTDNNPSAEVGLSDSDWVILTPTMVQRVRQSRASIMASSVLYDSSIIRSVKRAFVSNSSTSQSVIDNIVIYGLRRTGDSMTNDGSVGSGRFGVVYGSAAAPAIAFNDGNSDPDLNSGMIPSEWTDTSTGIFRQAAGSIGFSSTGVEKVRINSVGMIILEAANVNPVSAPALQFQGTGNTVSNPGITAVSNTVTFSIAGNNQVELKDASSLFHGSITVDQNLTVAGNTIIGDANTDTLVVNAVSTFNGTSNRFKNLSLMPSGLLTLENATTPTVISQTDGLLKFDMSTFADITINDGAAIRTKFNQYGIKLPILNPIDHAVGEDGMIAYSSQRNTVMQKSNGQWTTVSGGGVEQAFTTASWVLNGAYYTFTITGPNIQSIMIQEQVGSNYSPVDVDSIVISATNAVLSVPASPDLRFNGRAILTYR